MAGFQTASLILPQKTCSSAVLLVPLSPSAGHPGSILCTLVSPQIKCFSLEMSVSMESTYNSSFACLAGRFCPVLASKIIGALAAFWFCLFDFPVLPVYNRIYTRVSQGPGTQSGGFHCMKGTNCHSFIIQIVINAVHFSCKLNKVKFAVTFARSTYMQYHLSCHLVLVESWEFHLCVVFLC